MSDRDRATHRITGGQFGRPEALVSFALGAAILIGACGGSVWPSRARSVWPSFDTLPWLAWSPIAIP